MSPDAAEGNARARVPANDCRYDHELGYRVLANHHHEGCDGGMGDCDGCQKCTRTHCAVCTRIHVEQQTCAACIGAVRAALYEVLHAYGVLGEAMLDRAGADIPGGLPMVLCGPYSEGREALRLGLEEGDWTELDDDGIGPELPLRILTWWEDQWRRAFKHGAGPEPTMLATVGYLMRQLDRAAQEHEEFDQFAREVKSTRRQLQAAHGDADPTVHGVACFDCGQDLRQTFAEPRPCEHKHAPCGCDQGGRRDTWECTGCRRTYTDHDYRRAVRQAHTDAQPWRRAGEVTALTGVHERTLRRWADRGVVQRRREGLRGWSLYHLGQVRRHAMRGRLLTG